jgi:formyl-CoA transferase
MNPRLIYCSISGYGSRGPMQTRPGFDQVLQAMTGIAASQGGEGAPQVQVGSVVDYYTATLAAYGVMTALFVRERTGLGQRVETSLLQGALAMQSGRFIWADHEGREAKRDLAGGINRIFKTKHGHIYISAHTETFWQSLCQTIGLAQLGTDPRYDSMSKRSEHVQALVAMVEEALQAKTAEEWEELLSAADVPCSVARPIEDMFDHPQVNALDMVAHVTHPVIGGMRQLGVPIHFSKMPSRMQQPAPALGEHTAAILQSLGYTADQVAELKRAKVI